MNHQTQKLIEDAMKAVANPEVFSVSQIQALGEMLLNISRAIDKESDCRKPGYSSYGQGF